jgi:sugar lactone lactonase YvrE
MVFRNKYSTSQYNYKSIIKRTKSNSICFNIEGLCTYFIDFVRSYIHRWYIRVAKETEFSGWKIRKEYKTIGISFINSISDFIH